MYHSYQSGSAASTELLAGQVHEAAVGTFDLLLWLLCFNRELGSAFTAELLARRVWSATISASDHLLHILTSLAI